jgi:2',3'-cyclic-nucleotide 2'-phosphodiesterase (5'-nucleotidase family)
MNINNYGKLTSFGAATVNINAFSDTHGSLKLANCALEEMRNRQNDIFCKSEKGKQNILSVSGDWFMDGGKKGYISNPTKETQKYQLDIFNEFVNQIKGMASDTISLFTPGNHEFDGGVELLDDVLSNINADVIVSNLDIENSNGFAKSISGNKIINEKIIEVDDDEDLNIKHKILFLGVSPVNLSTYQPKLDGVKLLDNVSKPQRFVKKEDYETTLKDCKNRINKFRDENPRGIVILMSHTGVNFADTLANESNVDLIFDAHEHKDETRFVNGTPIVALSQNFEKIANAKINISADEMIRKITLQSFSPLHNKTKGILANLYEKLFEKDIKPQYSIQTENKDITSLDIKNIRSGNNYLANFVTDSVLEELKKKDDSIDFFALNATAMRTPLSVSDEKSISPLDIMNVLVGIKEEDGQIMKTDLMGIDIVYLVIDNIIFNKDMPQKNPLIQYSGLIVDKTSILQGLEESMPFEELSKYIIDERTGKPVELYKPYTIANVEKFFNKSSNAAIRKIKDISVYTGDTVQSLFKQHFQNSNGILYAKCDTRIK